jgi:hypothetical protein
MELWRGTMTAHSVILYGGDTRGSGAKIRFDDEHWLGQLPLRLPTTLCVQERLPAGAAGVLLNRSHPHTDLILAIDAPEKRMFDAIDGRRTIAHILGHARSTTEHARAFFETLWWYDQVVFNTAGTA